MLVDEYRARTEALAACLEAHSESPDDIKMQAAQRLRELDALCRDLWDALNVLRVQTSNSSSPMECMEEQALEHADDALVQAESPLEISEGSHGSGRRVRRSRRATDDQP
jgi:hypothetical protein